MVILLTLFFCKHLTYPRSELTCTSHHFGPAAAHNPDSTNMIKLHLALLLLGCTEVAPMTPILQRDTYGQILTAIQGMSIVGLVPFPAHVDIPATDLIKSVLKMEV